MSLRSSTALATLALAAVIAPKAVMAQNAAEVVAHYPDMALAKYEASLETARGLDATIEAFLANPSAETHAAAKRGHQTLETIH